MKLLLVLLACIAATNAAYCTYSYSYYRSHNYYFYPAKSYYRYTVYFSNDWCSANYYAPILKVYPGEACGKDGWTETPVEDLKAEIANLLAEALVKMVADMTTRRDSFMATLDACHAEFKITFANYCERYYNYRISCVDTEAEKEALRAEMAQKIAEYNDKLDQIRADTFAKYNEAIAERVACIQDYHNKLVEASEKCLTTRLEKIAEYEQALYEQVYKYLDQYWQYLVSVVKCRSDQYKQILSCIHVDGYYTKYKIDDLIAEFEQQECYYYKEGAYYEYYSRLYEVKAQLATYYRCTYTCTFTTGCLRFYKRRYYSRCQSLGNWYGYSRLTFKTRSGLAPFKYSWRKTTYKGLTKCDLAVLHKPADDIKAEFEASLQSRIAVLVDNFATWKGKWVDYHVEYCDIYDGIIKQRHEWAVENRRAYYVCLNNSTTLTPEQEAALADFVEELRVKRETAVAEYKQQLLDAIIKCVDEFAASIETYTENVNKMIATLIEKYNGCLETRTAKIAEYTTCLEEQITKQRDAFIKNVSDAKNCHYDAYYELLTFYSGDPLPYCAEYTYQEYAYELMYYCDGLLYDFDSCWSALKDQLVHHYSCNYKCIVGRFCLPSYCWGSYYSWRVSYPTANCYTYYYKRYTTYCGYRLTYNKGTYYYC